jgi:hypothetical protein
MQRFRFLWFAVAILAGVVLPVPALAHYDYSSADFIFNFTPEGKHSSTEVLHSHTITASAGLSSPPHESTYSYTYLGGDLPHRSNSSHYVKITSGEHGCTASARRFARINSDLQLDSGQIDDSEGYQGCDTDPEYGIYVYLIGISTHAALSAASIGNHWGKAEAELWDNTFDQDGDGVDEPTMSGIAYHTHDYTIVAP